MNQVSKAVYVSIVLEVEAATVSTSLSSCRGIAERPLHVNGKGEAVSSTDRNSGCHVTVSV